MLLRRGGAAWKHNGGFAEDTRQRLSGGCDVVGLNYLPIFNTRHAMAWNKHLPTNYDQVFEMLVSIPQRIKTIPP